MSRKAKTSSSLNGLHVPALAWKSAREWDRGTALIATFAVTGYIEGVRPQSLLLTGDPGTGKTELLERFRTMNPFLSYHSDITQRGLQPVLKQAARGTISHLVSTEFQKLFQRKLSVAENCLGMLVQSMEEGVDTVSIGDEKVQMHGARLGILAAMTHNVFGKKRRMLEEMGFLDRVAVLPWDLPATEVKAIMDNITAGRRDDLRPIDLPQLTGKVKIRLSQDIGKEIQNFVWQLRGVRGLRILNRFRGLAMAIALLHGKTVVTREHLQVIYSYDDYWKRLLD